jgi:hypothetical protein
MKRVCAWCGQDLDPSQRREECAVTHSVCPVCRRKFFPSTTDGQEAASRADANDTLRRAEESMPAG